jgi:hypothetical protein
LGKTKKNERHKVLGLFSPNKNTKAVMQAMTGPWCGAFFPSMFSKNVFDMPFTKNAVVFLTPLAKKCIAKTPCFHFFPSSALLRLVRQRVVMAVQTTQADVLINRLHDALPSWDGVEGRRDAQAGCDESAQARHGGGVL